MKPALIELVKMIYEDTTDATPPALRELNQKKQIFKFSFFWTDLIYWLIFREENYAIHQNFST